MSIQIALLTMAAAVQEVPPVTGPPGMANSGNLEQWFSRPRNDHSWTHQHAPGPYMGACNTQVEHAQARLLRMLSPSGLSWVLGGQDSGRCQEGH